MVDLTSDNGPPRRKPRSGRRSEYTGLSVAVAAAGGASAFLVLAGSLVVISSRGWVPSERVADAITSDAQLGILLLCIVLGTAAWAIGWASFRRMPTKRSREATAAGAALGVQGAVVSGALLWFRAGDVAVFARNFFEFEIVADFWPRFIRGAVNTVILAFGGEAIGVALGLVLAVFVVSRRAAVRAPARTYINFFRGTPLIWQLNFIFFGIVLGLRLDLTAYQAAILVLGLNAGAYSAEIFRAGIQSIERGQYEAARSLGMGYFSALWFVILPQAIRRVIPPLTNEFVILIKDTSLVSILGLTFQERELMAVGRNLYAEFFNATPFLASAAGYLVITIPMIRVVASLERRLRSGLTGIGA